MKILFDKLSKDYIGNYMQEYKKAGFLKVSSLHDVIKQRSEIAEFDILDISITKNMFAGFIIESVNNKMSDIKVNSNFEKIFKGIILNPQRLISYQDYLKISEILKQFTPNLQKYTLDFVLIAIYARDECFGRTQEFKGRQVIDDKQRRNVRNFFSSIARDADSFDVSKITVSYSQGDKNKTLKIDSPILMKMMLYEFAEEYFTFIEREDKEHWEKSIDLFFEKSKRGNKGNDYTPYLRALINVCWLYMEQQGILNGEIDRKYALLGRIFHVVGYRLPRNFKNTKYETEDEYYIKSLKKYWHP